MLSSKIGSQLSSPSSSVERVVNSDNPVIYATRLVQAHMLAHKELVKENILGSVIRILILNVDWEIL